MEEELWGKLPEDLCEKIFLKLSAASLFRCRAVRKSWLAALTCPNLLREWVKQERAAPTFFSLARRRSSMCECGDHYEEEASDRLKGKPVLPDAAMWEVYRLDLSFFSKKISRICHLHNGLICIRVLTSNPDALALVVCNPLTRTLRELPEVVIQESMTWMVGMVDDSGRDAFRVVLLVSDTQDHCYQFWTIRVYSSRTHSWRITQTNSFCPLRLLGSSLLHDRLMYTSLFHGLLMLYSTDDGKLLRQVEVKLPDSVSQEYYQLVQYKGDVFLVAQLDVETKVTFGIWKLDQSNMVWMGFSVLPDSQRNDLMKQLVKDWNLDDCTDVELLDSGVIGDFIFISVDIHNNESQASAHYRTQLLAFSLCSKSWHIFFKDYLEGEPPFLLEPRFDLFL